MIEWLQVPVASGEGGPRRLDPARLLLFGGAPDFGRPGDGVQGGRPSGRRERESAAARFALDGPRGALRIRRVGAVPPEVEWSSDPREQALARSAFDGHRCARPILRGVGAPEVEWLDPGTLAEFVPPGTAAPAGLSEHRLARALAAGRHAAERARLDGIRLCICGGIPDERAWGLAWGLLRGESARLPMSDPGFGRQAAARGRIAPGDPALTPDTAFDRQAAALAWAALRLHGEVEIAMAAGAALAGAQMGLPILLDGFAGAVAALAARRLRPGCEDWLFLTPAAVHPAHRAVQRALGLPPRSASGQARSGASAVPAADRAPVDVFRRANLCVRPEPCSNPPRRQGGHPGPPLHGVRDKIKES